MKSRVGAERVGSFRWAEPKDLAHQKDPELLSPVIMRQQTTLVTLASSRCLQRTSAAGWISPWEAGPLKWKPATRELFMLTCPVLSVGSQHLANWLITPSVTEARLPLTSIKLCFLISYFCLRVKPSNKRKTSKQLMSFSVEKLHFKTRVYLLYNCTIYLASLIYLRVDDFLKKHF